MYALILLLVTGCNNKRRDPYIEPQPVQVFIDKYIDLPGLLTAPCRPVYSIDPTWFDDHTWLDLYYESQRTIDLCNKKLELIRSLPIPDN